ncbi:MAG: hypothetical protein V1799_11670 [bacterium]
MKKNLTAAPEAHLSAICRAFCVRRLFGGLADQPLAEKVAKVELLKKIDFK